MISTGIHERIDEMNMNVSDSLRPSFPQINVTPRLLLGPGPSNAHPRVLQALGMRQLGHLDPQFLEIMNRNQELIRYVWQTDNKMCIPVSGTGSAAMEASFADLLVSQLRKIGLEPYAPDEIRLPSLITVAVPDDVEAKSVTSALLNEYNIEIGNGLGTLAGKVWRIGLMGFNSRVENVTLVTSALDKVLNG